MPLPKILKDLLALPTASFQETAVLAYVHSYCRGLAGVETRADRYGNLLATYRRGAGEKGAAARPGDARSDGASAAQSALVFTAHTDHPGFVALETVKPGVVRAAFRGYVETPYFTKAKVRFSSAGRWIPGQIAEVTRAVDIHRMGRQTSRPEEVVVRVRGEVDVDAPGMWDLPAPRLQGDRIEGPALDDLAGVAGLLALLERLSRKQAAAEVRCLFTRAEEVGFVGAIGAMKARTVPKRSPVIVVEMSKALPNARIGDGPIVRVGDRLSLYDPDLTARIERAAAGLAKRRKKFAFQRRLMDGGACEATGFAAYGYRASGICLPLGNYHNMDTEKERIAPEQISQVDWARMVELFEALVLETPGAGGDGAVRTDLERRFAEQMSLL